MGLDLQGDESRSIIQLDERVYLCSQSRERCKQPCNLVHMTWETSWYSKHLRWEKMLSSFM